MYVAFYTKKGPAAEVLEVGEIETPLPQPGEVRIRIAASGINPTDVKKRQGADLEFPQIVPHSDGAGQIDAVGDGVPKSRIGERVWTIFGQWQRPFGTAAEYICLSSDELLSKVGDGGFQAARSRSPCAAMKAVTSISTACAKRRCAPERKTAVKGSSENDPGWRSSTTLSSLMAYPFLMGIGDSASPGYAAFNSSRHQLSGIALIRSGGTSARGHERRRGGLSRHSRAYGLSGIDDRW